MEGNGYREEKANVYQFKRDKYLIYSEKKCKMLNLSLKLLSIHLF